MSVADSNQTLANALELLKKAERERDIYKRAVEQYAKKSLWVYSERPFSAFRTLYYPPDKQEHGYDIAQAAIREAEALK